jgi:hypothetical protein
VHGRAGVAGAGCRRTPFASRRSASQWIADDDLERQQRMTEEDAGQRGIVEAAPLGVEARVDDRAVAVVRDHADAQRGALGRGGSIRKAYSSSSGRKGETRNSLAQRWTIARPRAGRRRPRSGSCGARRRCC